MSKVTGFLSRILTLVLFALSWTRVAVTRILPSYQPAQEPASAKVFALTDAAWLELRAGRDVTDQEKSEPKTVNDQKDRSKKGDDSNASSKSSDDKKEPSKSADCDKAAPKTGDDRKRPSPSGDDKKKDGAKTGECDKGPGGGDGDMGGTGG